MPPLPRERFVLLFCHGGGLHKGVWTPIIRRLQAATLLQSVACEYVAFDWRYHATSACKDDPATLFYEENDSHRPRVDHPGMLWPQWAPEQLAAVLKGLKSEDEELVRTTNIIGVGHSMGANALLHHEVLYPGSFEALVLFEPVLTYECRLFGGAKWVMDMLVKATLTREDKWGSMEEAIAHAKQSRAYRRWHPESLDAFLMGAIQQSSDGTVRLTTPLLHEAAFYCHVAINYTEDQLARVHCPVVFEYGSHTGLCNLFGIGELVDALPERFTLAEPLDQYSHQMIVETPDECAERILMRLKMLPFFIEQHSGPTRQGAPRISRL